MATPDTERLLRRRLVLQRYVASLVRAGGERGELVVALGPGDRRLLDALGDFQSEADARELSALARYRTSVPAVRALLALIRETLAEQRAAITALLDAELPRLIETEARITAEAIGAAPPSTRGVLSEPVGGLTIAAVVAGVLAAFERRLLAEVTQSAASAPERLAAVVRGTRAERYRDGVLAWRNRLVLRPAADTIVNGAASNAAHRAYQAARIEELDWLATLDFRACPRCLARELDGPYPIERAPRPQEHPNCRCLLVPAQPPGSVERPFVLDRRSVKDIPKGERAGKIGTTREPLEAFLDRMSDADRRSHLGPARADLWASGKVTDIRGFVSALTNEPLRLDQLPG